MFDFGKYAFFIWGSYGIVVVVLTGLICWLISDGRRYSSALSQLEDRSSSSGQEKD